MPNEPNPYESSSLQAKPSFREAEPEVGDLEQRLAKLEMRVSRSWLLSPDFLRRVMAVWIYFIVGYTIIVAIVFPIVLLSQWLRL